MISFDEQEIAENSKANNRTAQQIVRELISVRNSTVELFKNLDETDFQKFGINWKYRITVEAMAFNIIGHKIHHLNFIEEKYFPLA